MTTTVCPQGCGARRTATAAGLVLLALTALLSVTGPAQAQEAKWIWSPEHVRGQVPPGVVHFRKTFTLRAPETGTLAIAADDAYEVRVNGKAVAAGSGYRRLVEHDISKHLARGKNVIAIRVTNTQGPTAGLVARVQVKEARGSWQSFSTDETWRTNLSPLPLWDTMIYNDTRWPDAVVLGRLGETAPWDRQENVAIEETHKSERFKISDEFTVQRVLNDQQTGSLIAMTFNEFGHVIASREGGPLLLLYDSNRDGVIDKVRTYCEKVKNCQGILALNGEVYVTADGPEGTGLYRLSDKNRDGSLEESRLLVKFRGEMGEHGPHAVSLGPDGLIYVMLGNLCSVDGQFDPQSPYRNYYEGDLVERYEDPGGHAVGVKAPGGSVIRTDVEGSVVQLVAGGLRNCYDLCFNRDGEMFAHDSDMETDEGAPWFRNTQLFHLTPGGEYGWRSGWSRWPEYYVDSLPPLLDTGRGSPTGCTSYNHFAFPHRYQNSLFLADWTNGRILSVKLQKSGGTYTASSEVFLEGSPLNVTDLEVGPDGALYFCTGGRGTGGGLYRVAWRGRVPPEVSDLGDGISAVIRQPQMQSAWSRQRLARLKIQLGDNWDRLLEGVARSGSNPADYRTRAVDLMQLFGSPPDTELLLFLSKDKSEAVRAKAAEVMGLHGDERTQERLTALLADADRTVRRKACEALVRAEQTAEVEKLFTALASDDRFESFAARRLLEATPVEKWREQVLETDNQRILIQGGLALATAHPDAQNSQQLVGRIGLAVQKFVSDRNFVDMLRVVEVAVHRGSLPPSQLDDLKTWVANEFPAGDPLMNRELIRILAYLQADEINDRYVDYLKSKAPAIEKLHVAMHLRFIPEGWKPDQKYAIIDYLEKVARSDSSSNLPVYVRNVTRDFSRGLTDEESRYVLARAVQWPNAALGSIYKLPSNLDDETLKYLKSVDRQLAEKNDESAKPLLVGIVAVLARSGDASSMEYLREIWRRDPERRTSAAMGLAQQPDGENWDYLVQSLAVLEGAPAVEVLDKLLTVDQAPEDPEYYRQVILRGLLLKDQGGEKAVALLQHWNEESVSSPGEPWNKALAKWQDWFKEKYPTRPEATLPAAPEDSKWKFDDLLEYLTVGDGARKGSLARGATIFSKAQCIKCHAYGGKGERIGPELTTLNKRFMRKEVLESILFPSHVISDQYASKTVVTHLGRQYTGIVAGGAKGEKVVLQSNGEKVVVKEDDIDEILPQKTSVMPAGLLDNFSQEDIADLFAFLMNSPGRAELASKKPAGGTTSSGTTTGSSSSGSSSAAGSSSGKSVSASVRDDKSSTTPVAPNASSPPTAVRRSVGDASKKR
ncbi:MAG TPA: HEAT repeat domain-containing protein [Pirellulaceae bacterium]|nr:HEAT repeat domain-containing protein [Pirellulaceae bacterium]